jgi:serine phosphatase RsbU (regulator of sigma subunit)
MVAPPIHSEYDYTEIVIKLFEKILFCSRLKRRIEANHRIIVVNPYALPSFCAFPLLLVIGLAVVLQNPRNKSNRLLCLILIVWALQSFSSGMLHFSYSEAEANFWNKWPYFFADIGMIIMMEFILLNSGGSQRLKEKMFKIDMRIHRRIIYVSMIFWIVILITTNQIVAPVKYYSKTGWEHQYGPFYLTMMICALYMLTYQLVLILRGIKSASNSIEKKFRISMLIAFGLWQIVLLTLGVIFPWVFDWQTHSISALGWIPMCFVLAYGLMRSQWETIHDLNISLDKKVQKRTLQLLNEKEKLDNTLRHLNSELDEAAKYVISMLPLPIKDGVIRTEWRFIPSESLGGDSFGYHWVDEDKFALYLLDVSGHGVVAALLSVAVLNTLRNQSLTQTDFCSPKQVLEALNCAFPSELHNYMFFTIWYGVYDCKKRILTYASGGHPPAILISADSAEDYKFETLGTKNCAIGIFAEAQFLMDKKEIKNSNSLYVFSDGVYEIPKNDGSMWKFDEFLNFVKLSEFRIETNLDIIYEHTKKIKGNEKLHDDFTILRVDFSYGT